MEFKYLTCLVDYNTPSGGNPFYDVKLHRHKYEVKIHLQDLEPETLSKVKIYKLQEVVLELNEVPFKGLVSDE